MPLEWKFFVYSWIFEVHSKHSDCILSAFQTFGPILVAGPNVLLMLKTFEVHSKWRNIERHSKCVLTAFWLHSKYSYGIPTAFETFWSYLRENWNSKPLQILTECPECASNEPECTSNASRLHSCYILSTFEVHSKYSSCILFEFLDVPTIFGGHSGSVLTAFEANSYSIQDTFQPDFGRYSGTNQTALVRHSKCILNILTAF